MTKELTFTNGLLTNSSGSSLNNPSSGARAYTFINGILTNVGQVLPGVTPAQLQMTFTNGLLTAYYIVSGSSSASSIYTYGWTEIYPYGDAAAEWQEVALDYDGSFIFVAANGSNPFYSSDSGSNWDVASATYSVPRSVACSNDGSNLIYCTSNNDAPPGGLLYKSSDSGASWTELTPLGAGTREYWHDVCIDSDGSFMGAVYASPYSGIWISTNSGATWSEKKPDGAYSILWTGLACDSDGTTIIACQNSFVAGHSRIWISHDSGASWSETRPLGDADGDWGSVDCSSDGSILIANSWGYGQLFISLNSGSSWTEVYPYGTIGETIYWTHSSCSGDGKYMIAGSTYGPPYAGGRLFYSTDTGSTWVEAQPAGDINGDWWATDISEDGSTMLAAGLYGRIYKATRL